MTSERSLFFLLLLVVLSAGCGSPTVPLPGTGTSTLASGQFKYTVDGATVSSADYPGAAALIKRIPLSSMSLELDFSIFAFGPSGSSYSSLNMMLNQFVTRPATYDLSGRTGEASIYTDSGSYESVTGTLELTEVDTVANRISGTFSFDAENSLGQTVHITSGSFHKVPILLGSYGQGHISATANHQPFSTTYDDIELISAYTKLGSLWLLAQEVSGNSQRVIKLFVPSAKAGTMTIGSSALGTSGDYSEAGPNSIDAPSSQGQISLTKFDATTHRMSGTFNFEGRDQSTNALIQITNGVINNVQWFEE